ncbi:hypothetical protein [Nonomuraea jiangxiensis]|uniref:hypothetical protein n=1 Tax=Nonomuraea jiangxiensis TaxID=633440 RepID=UPI0015A1D7B0|nr:hypothetical protein [Nonomuraea jiangxiensis]
MPEAALPSGLDLALSRLQMALEIDEAGRRVFALYIARYSQSYGDRARLGDGHR